MSRFRPWHILAGFAAAFLLALIVYSPALSGPFLFDDLYLPFALPGFAGNPLLVWITGTRPVLMFTFWVSHQLSGVNPPAYHLFNIVIHSANAVLIFILSRRLLKLAGTAESKQILLALFAAGVFLLHPLQTESVAYIASRSESLSGFFLLAACVVFLHRALPAISFPWSLAILALFGLATLTKEHTAVLPILLLLTDYYWNPGFSFQGMRRNWKLYLPMAAAATLGAVLVMRVLLLADTAGFGMKDLPWHHYLFTQFRVIWTYLRLALVPIGQNIDPDYSISRTIADPLAAAGLLGLLAATGASLYFRRRFPLASYGWVTFLILLAPTSSIVPIRDVIAERRMYLPLFGLSLVAVELLSRLRIKRLPAVAVVFALCAVLSFNRNKVWSSAFALWQDTVAKSPGKTRPNFQLAHAYYVDGRCVEAASYYETASRIEPPEPALLVDWALALDCADRPGDALAKLQIAATMEKSAHLYSQIGMMHGKAGRREEALTALDLASKLDPNYDMTYVYRGNVFESSKEMDRAAAEYSRALALNPANDMARSGLQSVTRRPAP